MLYNKNTFKLIIPADDDDVYAPAKGIVGLCVRLCYYSMSCIKMCHVGHYTAPAAALFHLPVKQSPQHTNLIYLSVPLSPE